MQDNPAETAQKLPSNIEAEQALLGALLINNEAFDTIASILLPEHFFEPLHIRLYTAISRRIQQGQSVDAISLRPLFAEDEAMKSLGGGAYLDQLTNSTASYFNLSEFAHQIYDLAIRRELIKLGENIQIEAKDTKADISASMQIVDAEKHLYALAEKGRSEGGFQSFGHSIAEAVENAQNAYQREGRLSGLSTGLKDLDYRLGGLHPSDLIILAGRPSMGKTALATNIAFNIAKAYQTGTRADGSEGTVSGGVVGFFSLEMSADQLATRILAEQATIASERLRRGDIDEEEFHNFVTASRNLEIAPLFIDDTGGLPMSTLVARARRLKRQKGLDVLFIDYLQLVRGSSGRSNENRVQEVSEITQGLKALAKELDIPIIALSQLSRQVEQREDKRPQLADLRESGSIEQDADVVLFVFREEYYVGRQEPREGTVEHQEWQNTMAQLQGLAEVVIGKQRHGAIGHVQLQFESKFTRFSDLARDSYY